MTINIDMHANGNGARIRPLIRNTYPVVYIYDGRGSEVTIFPDEDDRELLQRFITGFEDAANTLRRFMEQSGALPGESGESHAGTA